MCMKCAPSSMQNDKWQEPTEKIKMARCQSSRVLRSKHGKGD